MKTLILITAGILFIGFKAFEQDHDNMKPLFIAGFSEDLRYEVRGKYACPLKEKQLHEAARLRDLIPGYPVNWIRDYVSVEIQAIRDGEVMKTVSAGEALNSEQKHLLNTLEPGTDVVISVNYTYQNGVSDSIEKSRMHLLLTVVPDVEAEYIGGFGQMISALKENGMDQVFENTPKQFQHAIIRFTINEEGKISDAKITATSGNPRINELLLEAIYKMPPWKPAINAQGIKVKQQFELSVGNNGGC